jgi:uncharacterized membrane protein
MDIKWQGSVDISAPVDQVYAYLADFPKHCEWAQTLESMELKKAGDASGVGAVYRTKEKQALQADRPPRGPLPENAGGGTTDCEVTELVPSSRIAWKSHPVPIRMGTHAEMAFDLAPINGDATRLTQSIHFHMPDLVMKMFAKFQIKDNTENIQTRQKAQWQASLNNIKTIMEEA